MHQIRLRPGSAPDPAGGAHSAPPDHLAGLKGLNSNRKDGKKEGGRKKGEKAGPGEEGKDRDEGGGEEKGRREGMRGEGLVYIIVFFLNCEL